MGKTIDIKLAATATSILGAAVWASILAIKGIAVPFTWEAIKEIPTAAGYVATAVYLFTKWGWKFRIFRGWLVLVPDLNGTWKGEIRSNWTNPATGQKTPPIPAFLVIRQTLTKISCVQFTAESPSYSRAASIEIDRDHDAMTLEFIYTNTPRVRVQDRSKAHDGATVLDILTEPTLRLDGKYWTDRETKGEMEFKLISRKHRQSFAK